MPKIDLPSVPEKVGSTYPPPYAAACATRRVRRLGEAGGLTLLGVTQVVLPPGAQSSQRHWHHHEDEFMWVVSGEVIVITDEGEELLHAGDCAAFPARVKNGHCVVNRSDRDAVLLAISNRSDEDFGEYPDIDLQFAPGRYSGKGRYLHKDGTPY